MKGEERIVGLLSEMLHKFDVMTDEVVGVRGGITEMKGDIREMKGDVKELNKRLDKVEREIIKLNLISAENSRALMKLGDNAERITRLERAVFK